MLVATIVDAFLSHKKHSETLDIKSEHHDKETAFTNETYVSDNGVIKTSATSHDTVKTVDNIDAVDDAQTKCEVEMDSKTDSNKKSDAVKQG